MNRRADSWKDWAAVVTGIILSGLLLVFGRDLGGHPSDRLSLSLTVVPSDSEYLRCKGSFRIGGAACAYDDQGRAMGTPMPLRPYLTVNRQLFLLEGVFEAPAVAAWLTRARATGSTARVTLACSATSLGATAKVQVQWESGGAWGTENDVAVARVDRCEVLP